MTRDSWLKDIPQQFLGKKNIEILISVFAKQMDELYKVYEDMKYATTLENAKGQNLRYVGDILSTSITDAQSILMAADNSEITDETYRKVLQYKSLQNNCDCTYYDIMQSIDLLWGAKKVKYVEDPQRPAVIYIELEDANIDGVDPAIGRVLAIKPAGVSMIYAVGYLESVNISGNEKAKMPGLIIKLEPMVNKEAVIQKIRMNVDTEINENISFTVITNKNMWYLDGTYLLDGTRKLNAEQTKEVL